MNKEICYSDLILLTQPVEKNVDALIEYGADKIEILMDGIEWDEVDDKIAKMRGMLKNYGVGYTVHPTAWDTNLTSENKAIRQASFNEYKKAIEFAHDIEAEHVVIHPGFCFSPVFDKKTAQKRAEEYINELCRVAAPLGVRLAVENVGYNGSSIFTQEEYVRFLDHIDDTAGYLIDTGHAHLNQWDVAEMIRQVQQRLISLHLHDNSGKGDEHLPVGKGTINWNPIFEELNKIKAPCQLILEYAPNTDLEELKRDKERLQVELNL